jgi:hypothetical protein
MITLYSNCQTSSTEQASCEAGGQDANGDYAVATFPPGMYVPGTTYGNYEFGYSGAQFWIEAGGATSNRITLPPA